MPLPANLSVLFLEFLSFRLFRDLFHRGNNQFVGVCTQSCLPFADVRVCIFVDDSCRGLVRSLAGSGDRGHPGQLAFSAWLVGSWLYRVASWRRWTSTVSPLALGIFGLKKLLCLVDVVNDFEVFVPNVSDHLWPVLFSVSHF